MQFIKKVKYKNDRVKIYPVRESDENIEKFYKKVIEEMVDYQIENNIMTEELFNLFSNKIDTQLNEFKQTLMQKDMELYYGSIYYMVERSIFTINCIKHISNQSSDLVEMYNTMLHFKKKYIDSRGEIDKKDDFYDVNDDFYDDYDLIESNYKKILIMEEKLLPIVVEQWKEYLTNPLDDDDNYKYIMHCFHSSMIDPNLMKKACCSLYTPKIENYMYGTFGLIYDIDVDSIDTMCTDDAGSWVINKETFIKNGCPGRWQLTQLEGDAVWYEYPYNSKLILPDMFEKDCCDKIEREEFHYSEIFLNKKARPVGVFYTDECQNVEEVKLYAKMNNLPLVMISVQKKKSK